MQVLLSSREYESLVFAAQSVPELLDSVKSLSEQLNALRSMYTELLDKVRDIERAL